MKISKQELRRVFETVGRAAGEEFDERFAYIEFSKENDSVVARATNAYLLLKTQVNAEFTEDYNIYIKPFKIGKKDIGFFDIKIEDYNNEIRTVIRSEENLSTQPLPIYPNLKCLDSFTAREHFETKVCLSKENLKALVASAQKRVTFYLTDEPNKMVKVKVDDNLDGLMAPIKCTEDE